MIMRPSDEKELQKREAIGTIRASRFVRRYARLKKHIDVQIIREIHREIFKDAWQEIAGVYRYEEIKITDSKHFPPHHSQVVDQMINLDLILKEKLEELESLQGVFEVSEKEFSEKESRILDVIISVAAWVHHKITYILPFRDGNGRTARLATNLILERHGLVGISIRIEKENKNAYRNALSQIDQYDDYEPLKELITKGIIDRYDGIPMKFS